MDIEGVAVYPGHPCPHRCDTGCDNYAHRPLDPCKNFICGWLQPGSPLPDYFRPDLAGVIILPEARCWQNLAVDVAVPVGRFIPPETLQWLKQFAMRNNRPLLYLEQDSGSQEYQLAQNVMAYGPPLFQAEIQSAITLENKLW